MVDKKQRLELTWIGKEKRPRLEPRILLEDTGLSYHSTKRVSQDDIFDNTLIRGDNLLALKALEQVYAGKIKCVFIDPPYNTGSAFEHYSDGLEHSLWLSLMRDRLELLWRLIADDGSLWITIDDNEAHYLKVMLDEIFGRSNFAANCIWQKVYSERMDAKGFSVSHDHILVYRKSPSFSPRQLPKPQQSRQFNYYDEDEGRFYRRRSLRKEGSESRRRDRPSMWYPIDAPDGGKVWPIKPDGTEGRWRWKEENVPKKSHLLEFVKAQTGWEIYVKQYLKKNPTRPPATLWLSEEVGHNHEAKLEVQRFNSVEVFQTPKPERLLKRVLEIATVKGDLILDSFGGSGTSAAVAHKMRRRWIMVELGSHAETHIIPRLRSVIDGMDEGGVTDSTAWKGGGGFRFFRLAPSLLEKDQWGNWVVSKDHNPEMLAEAMCKLEGFSYDPDPDLFWIHGRSTETDFIYVTTQNLSRNQLQFISDQVGDQRTLLICCSAFRAKRDEFNNLTVKKIPQAVLKRCEWGRDDYSLNVEALPPIDLTVASDVDKGPGRGKQAASKPRHRRKAPSMQELPLFNGLDSEEHDE